MLFSLVGGLIGVALVLMASTLVPKLMNRLTPNIDEEKEIARGNTAVAEYYGRVVGACILGLSIVIGAAVLGGLISALH
jgi:multidrug efflux pump subunit AcrB